MATSCMFCNTAFCLTHVAILNQAPNSGFLDDLQAVRGPVRRLERRSMPRKHGNKSIATAYYTAPDNAEISALVQQAAAVFEDHLCFLTLFFLRKVAGESVRSKWHELGSSLFISWAKKLSNLTQFILHKSRISMKTACRATNSTPRRSAKHSANLTFLRIRTHTSFLFSSLSHGNLPARGTWEDL